MRNARTNRKKSIAAGSPCRSFDSSRKTKSLRAAALSIVTLAVPLALHAQSVTLQRQSTVPATGLASVSGLAVDGSGNLYIADNKNGDIVKLTPAGVQTALPISIIDVAALAVDSAGNLFIEDNGNPGSMYVTIPALREYTRAGSLITIMEQGLGAAQGLTIDNAEDILASNAYDGTVSWAPYGTPPSGWNNVYTPAASGSYDPYDPNQDNPYNLAMGPFNPVSGIQNAFVALTGFGEIVGVPGHFSSGKGSYNQNQQFTVASGLNSPLGVAADSAGNVYISNTNSNNIVEVLFAGNNSSGLPTYSKQITLPVTGLNRPNGLAVDAEGNLYIADENNSRVVKLQPSSVSFGAVNVCSSGQTSPAPCNNAATLTFNVTASGTLAPPEIFTQGLQWTPSARNAEFALAPGSTCQGAVTSGSTCTVNVTFAPKYPGLRTGAVQLVSSTGNILATVPVYGYGQGPQVAFNQAAQSTARFPVATPNPTSAVVDAAGNFFIAQQNGEVLKFMNGSQQLVASGLNGGGLNLAVDGADNVYIADPVNNQVLKVTAKGAQSTVGSGLNRPNGVAVDGEGNVFIGDSGNNRVVEVNSTNGAQFTIGTGLNNPIGVAVDGLGDLYVADLNNQRVVEVSANGTQTTVGTGLVAPTDLAVDAAGDVYIVDQGLDEVVKVTPSGTQTTIGTGLVMPFSVSLDGAGDVFITDWQNNDVVEVQQSQAQALSFTSIAVGAASAPQSVTVQNIGNQPLNATGLSVGSNFKQEPGSGTPEDCTSNVSLADGASCNLSIIFTPSSTGSISSSAVLTDNSLNSTSATQSVRLTGTGTAQ